MAVNTGLIESWSSNPTEIGPMYPFVGFEVVWFVISLILWVAYTLWQMKFERDTYAAEVDELANRERGSRRVVIHDGG